MGEGRKEGKKKERRAARKGRKETLGPDKCLQHLGSGRVSGQFSLFSPLCALFMWPMTSRSTESQICCSQLRRLLEVILCFPSPHRKACVQAHYRPQCMDLEGKSCIRTHKRGSQASCQWGQQLHGMGSPPTLLSPLSSSEANSLLNFYLVSALSGLSCSPFHAL